MARILNINIGFMGRAIEANSQRGCNYYFSSKEKVKENLNAEIWKGNFLGEGAEGKIP
jgi:hypothetical protein